MKGRVALALACVGATAGLLAAPVWAAPGDLDPTFSRDGLVTTGFGLPAGANAVAIQPDGKIVVAGSAGLFVESAGGDAALARYRPDGELDPSFSSDGKLTDDFGGEDEAKAIALQSDGKIVVLVQSYSPDELSLARYDSDGTPDSSFSGDGRLTFDFGGGPAGASDVALDSEGNIVVAGTNGYADAAAARFKPNGDPDTSFSGDGVATVDFGGADSASSVAVEPDDGLVLGGSSSPGGYPNQDFAVARLMSNGNPDSSFSGDGKQLATIGDLASVADVALQSDGKIVAAGNSCSGDVHGGCSTAVARFGADGSLDSSFGHQGSETLGGSGGRGLALTPDGGMVIAAGTSADAYEGGPGDFPLIRLDSSGALAAGFRGGGIWTTDFRSGDDVATAVALQQDGKIVAAGRSDSNLALARYLVAAGPHDADADGIRDSLDRCPPRFGVNPSGCPHYRRSLSMEYRKRQDLDVGVLKAREPECVDSERVRVYRERRGPDFLVDKAFTDYAGNWSIDARLHPGHYYAVAQPSFGSAYGRCLKAHASGFRI